MRNYYFLTLFFILFYSKTNAQTTASQLVLGIPECYQTATEWDKVKSALTELNGVQIKGICTRHDCILLEVDRSLFPTNQPIFDKIKAANAKFTIFIKRASFEDMMTMCQEELTKKPK